MRIKKKTRKLDRDNHFFSQFSGKSSKTILKHLISFFFFFRGIVFTCSQCHQGLEPKQFTKEEKVQMYPVCRTCLTSSNKNNKLNSISPEEIILPSPPQTTLAQQNNHYPPSIVKKNNPQATIISATVNDEISSSFSFSPEKASPSYTLQDT
jgi:hypothetical protein